jgi:hypothetical protein
MPAVLQRDAVWGLSKSSNGLLRRKQPCNYQLHSSGQQLPTLVFRSVNGDLDDLVKSMCAGKLENFILKTLELRYHLRNENPF